MLFLHLPRQCSLLSTLWLFSSGHTWVTVLHLLWGKMLQWVARACCLFEPKAQGVYLFTSVLKAGVAFFSEYTGGGWGPSNTGDNRVTKHITHAQTVAFAVLYSSNKKQEHLLKNWSSASLHLGQRCCPLRYLPSKYHSSNHPLFALHRVRQQKRMVSTIRTFVWLSQICL